MSWRWNVDGGVSAITCSWAGLLGGGGGEEKLERGEDLGEQVEEPEEWTENVSELWDESAIPSTAAAAAAGAAAACGGPRRRASSPSAYLTASSSAGASGREASLADGRSEASARSGREELRAH
eukprot:CAMPEP_0115712892 /NCGR_PEP_ID=MMETSP0272-20121206/74369_1 /TAXON_ID=71861 /ORGANISM="Scrippsiella trochoidea, Strain CCMP3099" /LENGTH=123 /DNA_ID=CAMNT_0003154843 /DNA_START=17 /DNA_END=386 /DNA_ORIENTATION=+